MTRETARDRRRLFLRHCIKARRASGGRFCDKLTL